MDLEMTGLDPVRHVIVEIATLITDDDLRPIAEGPNIVIAATAEQLGEMDGVVHSMHLRSGLLAAIQASPTSLAEGGRQTLEFLRAHIAKPRTVPLCGNSIGTDRRFLAAHLPDVEDFLHYRLDRCFEHQGTLPAMVSGRPGRRSCQEGRRIEHSTISESQSPSSHTTDRRSSPASRVQPSIRSMFLRLDSWDRARR